MQHCAKCNTDKELSEFYLLPNGKLNHAYCKKCQNQNVLDRQRLWKQKAIEYKGSKCCICSYDRCNAALEFHHKDPSQKDFQLAAGRLKKFENSRAELDKCVLVCSNCHREIHLGLVQCPDLGG